MYICIPQPTDTSINYCMALESNGATTKPVLIIENHKTVLHVERTLLH